MSRRILAFALLLAVTSIPPAPFVVQAVAAGEAAAVPQRELRSALQVALSRPAPATVAPDAARVLEFRRDPAVTARERERAIEHLRRSGVASAALERQIRSGRMLADFDLLLRRHGYSPTNLGDVLAAYLVLSWEVVSGRDAMAQPEGMRAVRRQLAAPLAGVQAIADLDDAAKQGQAERSAYIALLAAAMHQELRHQGGSDRLARLRASVDSSLRRSGVDLRSLELTPGGLVAR